MREGLSLAIVGPPNAGKSSLLNALLGEERAIVAAVAGTTRDVIEERFIIDGVPVRVLDTAGLRASDDPVERIGIERARRALAAAAVALVVVDGARAARRRCGCGARPRRAGGRGSCCSTRAISARAGYDARGAAEARRAAAAACSIPRRSRRCGTRSRRPAGARERIDLARPHLASARQADAVARAREALARARATLEGGDALDLIAPELLAAIAALGEITGAVATEAILDGIFARFCIGK